MDLLSLPDDCLLLILKLCPLQTLLSLRRISTRFHDLVTSICTAKRSLKIFGSPFDMQVYLQMITEHYVEDISWLKVNPILDDVLIIKDSNSASVMEIPKIFPQITNLVINFRSLSHFDLFQLVHPWAMTLDSFGIYELPANYNDNLEPIWTLLSRMTSLTKLHLLMHHPYRIPDHLPIIPQLEVLVLINYHGDLVPILSRLARPVYLILAYVYLDLATLERLIEVHPRITNLTRGADLGFLHSGAGNRAENYQKVLQFLCQHFREMNFIDLMFGEHLPLNILVPSLAHLPKLTNLTIYIGRDQLPTKEHQFYELPQLSSVKRLHLEVYDLTLTQFWRLIPTLFPAVETLRIKSDFGLEDDDKRTQFVEQLQQEFKCLNSYRFN